MNETVVSVFVCIWNISHVSSLLQLPLANRDLQVQLSTSVLTETPSSFYAHFKAYKIPFPSASSDSTFDLVFLKMRYIIFINSG
jgi:hypothetical protein